MASVVVAVCLTISVLFGQNRVLTSFGFNVSLFRSIARETAATNLIIMELGRIFVRAVRWMTSTGITIVSLRNEGFPTFCLYFTTGRHLGFTER